MTVYIQFVGFHTIYEQYKEPFAFPFAGDRIPELVDEMIGQHGKTLQDALQDERLGTLDPVIQVRVNERTLSRKELGNHVLTEGDRVTFMKLLSGG